MSKEAEKLKVIENLPKVGTRMFNQALSLIVIVHSLTWMLKDLVIFWVVLCSPSGLVRVALCSVTICRHQLVPSRIYLNRATLKQPSWGCLHHSCFS